MRSLTEFEVLEYKLSIFRWLNRLCSIKPPDLVYSGLSNTQTVLRNNWNYLAEFFLEIVFFLAGGGGGGGGAPNTPGTGYIFFTLLYCFMYSGMMVQSRVFFWNRNDIYWDYSNVPPYSDTYLQLPGMGIFGLLFRASKIQYLDLDRLPALRSMCKLDLSHSQLYKLPDVIGSLPCLTHLFLNDNHLSSLQPEIIRRLVNLQELDLRNNQLNDCSLVITELSSLQRLSVQGNPLNNDETRKLMKLAHSERWIDIAGECKIL